MGLLNTLAETEVVEFLLEDWGEGFSYEGEGTPATFTGCLFEGASNIVSMGPGDEAIDGGMLYIEDGEISLLTGQHITRDLDSSVWMIGDVPPAEYGFISIPVKNMRRLSLGKM